jgi:hypothetical protein
MSNFKYYLFFKAVLLFLFFSCTNNAKDEMLTNNGVKFWDSHDMNSEEKTGTSYSFDKNHKCRYYIISRQDSTRKIFNGGDFVNLDSTWKFEGENYLWVNGYKRRILKLTSSKLLLQNIVTGDSILLIESSLK